MVSSKIPSTHVLVSDINTYACETLKNNFGDEPLCCDIKTLTNIPDFDILLGGFPCQGFSAANQQRSEHDERTSLYLEILRVLKEKQPQFFILENVRGITSMGGYENSDKKNKKGRVVKNIIHDLSECGYKVDISEFELSNHRVPQIRGNELNVWG